MLEVDQQPAGIPPEAGVSDAPIFILGNGRSGTTLMRFMLNAHPDIYLCEEVCYHFWMRNFYGSYRRRLYQFFQSFSYAWLRMPPQVVLDALPQPPQSLTERDGAQVYRTVLRCKAAQYGKSRHGEKGPLLVEDLDQLFRDYPDAKVIHMVRDPRAVVHSHFTMPWSTSSFIVANLMVRTNMRRIVRHGDRILAVKLEELIDRPEAVMRQVLAFVDAPWSEQVLHHTEYRHDNDGIPFPWLMEATRRPQQKALRWQEAVPPAWIRLTEAFNRQVFERYGYAAQPLLREPGQLEKMRAILADLPQLILNGWRFVRMAIIFILLPRDDAAGFQAVLHSLNPQAWQRQPGWDSDLPAPPPVCPPEQLLK